jgi:DNA (cytosine-5)-methyltransferase 1
MVEHMMGYPEGWVDGISRTGQLKALGNAIVPHQAAAAWGHLLGLDMPTESTHTHTHTCCPRHERRTPTVPATTEPEALT